MLETVAERKNAFNGFVRRLEMANERISGLKNMSIDTSKKEKQRKKRMKTKTSKTTKTPQTRTGYPELWDNYKK